MVQHTIGKFSNEAHFLSENIHKSQIWQFLPGKPLTWARWLFPPSPANKQMATRTHLHPRTCPTLAWSMHCAIWELCVMGYQQGDGSMCCCSLSICLSVYSHILPSADSSSLLYCCCTVWDNLHLTWGLEIINLIHLNLTHGGFSPAVLHAVQLQCLWSSLPVHWKHRGALERKKGSG